MTLRRFALAALLALMLTLLHATVVRAQEHDMADPTHWYPWACCSANDCAPADLIERVPEWNGRWMTSKHGRVWVPDSKKAYTTTDDKGREVDFEIPAFEEIRTHVCMRKPYAWEPQPERGDMHVICVFQETGG